VASTQLHPIEILIVEDNPGDVFLTREVLEKSKILNTIKSVPDGEAAMQYLRREGRYQDVRLPDLVLLDLNLPKMDGRTVLEMMKADDELRKIPVVILTSSQAPGDIEGSYARHANCYLTKPVQFHEFAGVVRSIDEFWLGLVKLPGTTRS
jgi:CheY-like chemotaxis protein